MNERLTNPETVDQSDGEIVGCNDIVTWRLCYVSGHWAWFTSQSLGSQRGDDWNDAPYEHNAGEPYAWRPDGNTPEYKLCKVVWEGPFVEPCENHCNSPYSVESINAGASPWLRTDQWVDETVCVPAGVDIDEFTKLIRKAGGDVYRLAR